MSRASKPRAKLSEAQVLTIFHARTSALTAPNVAMVFGVSDKTVRDIWKGRTWSRETWHLDKSRSLQIKELGRPKGSRDTKPRTKRVIHRDELAASTGSTAHCQVPSQPCSAHTDRRGVAGHAFMQDAVDGPLAEHAHWMAKHALSADSGACIQDSGAVQRSSRIRGHASVDEQLHCWDEFWCTSTSEDPFRGDWNPYWSKDLAQ